MFCISVMVTNDKVQQYLTQGQRSKDHHFCFWMWAQVKNPWVLQWNNNCKNISVKLVSQADWSVCMWSPWLLYFRAPKENPVSYLSERRCVFDYDEFDVFNRDQVDMSRISQGKK